MNTCSVPDCDRPYRCSGYCDAHYRRYRRSGDAEAGGEVRDRLGGTPAERFEAKTLKTDGCWLWQGRPNGSGYGTFKSEDGAVMAHHYALKLAGTDVPTGIQVDHLCRVPLCVNPDHLEVVTILENEQRMHAVRRARRNGARTTGAATESHL